MGLTSHNTTELDFKLFIQEFEYWQKKFGLLCWEISFEKKRMSGLLAGLNYDIIARNACIALADSIPLREYSKLSIMLSAFHEACELLLGELNAIIEDSKEYLPASAIKSNEAERHKVIMILQNVLFFNDLAVRMGVDNIASMDQLTELVESIYGEKSDG